MTKHATGGIGSLIDNEAPERRVKKIRAERNARRPRDTRQCAACGKPFTCAPGRKKVTCGPDCAEKYHSAQQRNRAATKKRPPATDAGGGGGGGSGGGGGRPALDAPWHWVVQSNLGTSEDYLQIAAACSRLKLRCTLLPVEPFNKAPPDVPRDLLTIFYGSTRFVNNAFTSGLWTPCAFFDPAKFQTTYWGPIFGKQWLNHGAKMTILRDFVYEPHQPDCLFFVRPVRDLKEFTGGVWTFNELKRWNMGLLHSDQSVEQLATVPIIVAEPWGIGREWRLFIVNGRVSQASQYKEKGVLKLEHGAPDEVCAFAAEMAYKFSPHAFFVMDVCESAGNLYVVELGCLNCAGFYLCDIQALLEDIMVCLKPWRPAMVVPDPDGVHPREYEP